MAAFSVYLERIIYNYVIVLLRFTVLITPKINIVCPTRGNFYLSANCMHGFEN